jgi:glyoxylase-like metal-dependent hydrolase (beta-lactamase superfamily II)
MTSAPPSGVRAQGLPPARGAPADPPGRGAELARLARRIAAPLLLRTVLGLVLLVACVALISRVSAGIVTKPVVVAPGIIAERGNGAWLYALRLPAGVVLVDAGRDARGRPIDAALAPLGARRADVTDVLLTHGHPSETMGLASVQGARVHAGAADVPVITGRERPGRGLDRIAGLVLPHGTAQVADAIPGEQQLEVAGERIAAFPVPGHSLGSIAYLARGILFVGDAAAFERGRLVAGPRFLSADQRSAERALIRLAKRVAGEGVARVCTASGGCSASGEAEGLLREAASRAPPG